MDDTSLNKKKLKSSPNIIGILAGKGGVGKSTITAELALALTKEGYKVGVLDADIYGPSIRHLLPEDQPPKTIGNKVAPARCKGISLISAAYFPKRKAPSGVRAPIANQLINQFIEEVEWGALDFLLIDFPPGTGDIQITLMQKLIFNGALIVTTPEELSLLDVRKSVEMCLQMGVPLLGVIENMSYFSLPESQERHYLFGKGGGQLLANEFEIPLLDEIPIDKGLNQPTIKKKSDLLFKKLGVSVINALKEEKGCKIKGVDRYHFSIEWLDGKKSFYRFSDVQGKCPCIECAIKNKNPALDVEGLEMIPVGSYGMQFVFSKGCSKGIYPFSTLRKLDR
ncbi:MAG: P-loop NTPase [Simkaniaceae bacterium]|nr:MAG: P-loop NTPase [Simkaniaceae bacterium]